MAGTVEGGVVEISVATVWDVGSVSGERVSGGSSGCRQPLNSAASSKTALTFCTVFIVFPHILSIIDNFF